MLTRTDCSGDQELDGLAEGISSPPPPPHLMILHQLAFNTTIWLVLLSSPLTSSELEQASWHILITPLLSSSHLTLCQGSLKTPQWTVVQGPSTQRSCLGTSKWNRCRHIHLVWDNEPQKRPQSRAQGCKRKLAPACCSNPSYHLMTSA